MPASQGQAETTCVQLHPELRDLPLLLHRPAEPVRHGGTILEGCMPDGSFRLSQEQIRRHVHAGHVRRAGLILQHSVVKVDDWLPLETGCSGLRRAVRFGAPRSMPETCGLANTTAVSTASAYRHQRGPGRDCRSA